MTPRASFLPRLLYRLVQRLVEILDTLLERGDLLQWRAGREDEPAVVIKITLLGEATSDVHASLLVREPERVLYRFSTRQPKSTRGTDHLAQRGSIDLKPRYFVAACCVVEADSEEEAEEIAHASDIEWTIQSAYLIDKGTLLHSDRAPRPLDSPATLPQRENEGTNVPQQERRSRRWYDLEVPAVVAAATAVNPGSLALTLGIPAAALFC